MALTNATTLADYSSGIGTQGATLKVDADNQRVGIGTLTPAETLDVVGNMAVEGDFSVTGTISYEDLTNVDSVGLITARNGIEVTSGTATYGILLKGSADPIIRTELTDGSVSAGQTIGRIEWKANDGSTDGSQVTGYIESIAQAAFTGQGSPSHLIFGTNGASGPNALTERLRITHDGNVGIGTDNPGRLLHLYDIDAPPLLIDRNLSGERYVVELRQSDTTDGNRFRLAYQSDTTGAGAASNVNFASIEFAADIHDQATRAGSIRFNTTQGGVGNEIERLRITGIGSVGINETTPQQQLHVHDDTGYHGIFINGNGAPRINFARDVTTTAEWSVGVDGTNGTRFAIADSAGNTAKLIIDVGGNVNIAGITTATQLYEGTTRVATSGKAIAMALIFG